VDARLFDDMAPSIFRSKRLASFCVGLEAMKTGVFAPPALVGPVPFADLQAMIGKAETALKAFTPSRSTAGRARTSTSDRPAEASLHVGDPHPFVLAAQLLFPRRHRHTTSCARGVCRSEARL